MLITNQTTQDYWFGPLHLAGGVGQTLTVDDTTATSLYLADENVADLINNLYASGKITVSSQASPFPRPVGSPTVLHGDGSPEGILYAPQGTIYLRRDNALTYQKASGVHLNTGWLCLTADLRQASAAQFETVSRCDVADNISALTSAQLTFAAVWLPIQTAISNITFVSGATALATGVNQWFCLYDQNLNKLGVTADDTSNAWAANAAKTLAFASAVETTYSGLFYVGCMVKATTVPTLAGGTLQAGVAGLAPKLAGTSTGSLTNPASAPATATALTALNALVYAYVA